jgi:predicted alpha/beta hydrolase
MDASPLEAPRAEPSLAIPVVAKDGLSLGADLHLPSESPPRAAVLLAPAMGVPRAFYRRFAEYLAGGGLAVLTVDYRGIGGSRPPGVRSLRGFSATMADWATLDLGAAARALRECFAGVPSLWVGHSLGGQLLGLVPDAADVKGALFVGSQSGYWGHWSGATRVGMAALWFGVVPAMVGTLGYLPMKALGSGEDVPGGVAREWASWGRDPAYVGSDASRAAGFARVRAPMRAYALADDRYAPKRAVEGLLDLYAGADKELRFVRPRDVGAKRIGHFGFFRPGFEPSLWREARAWLLARAEVPS